MPTLDFKGKQFVYTHHLSVPFRTLEIDSAKSLPRDGVPSLDDNLIIHGDNLHALKALLPTYAGKVKCIYIDPPYNTGAEGWCYNDRVNSPLMREWLKKEANPVDKEDLERHDKWLSMMWPRLQLLRDFLSTDGIILVSIDDNEAHHLRSMMDEIFGSENFLAQLVWEKSRKNDAKYFSSGHEYMLVYAHSKAYLDATKTVWREAKPGARAIWDKYQELRKEHGEDDAAIEESLQEWYKSLPKTNPAKKLSRYKQVDSWGPWRDRDISWPGGGGPTYDVPHPITGKPCKVPERGWGFATWESMQRQILLGLVVFRDDHTNPPFRKAHLIPVPEELDENGDAVDQADEEDLDLATIGMQVMPSVIYKQSQVTVKALRSLMGAKVFDTPKDVEVLARIFRYVADENAIFLDSFAGSGATAHAVLSLNKEDNGNRRFILVEMEDYADRLTAERVRRAIQGVPKAKNAAIRKGLGGSFTFCTLGEEINVTSLLKGSDLPSYESLARYVFFTATGKTLGGLPKRHPDWFIGETDLYRIHLIYQSDREFLRGPEAALNSEMVDIITGGKGIKAPKKALVFASVKFMGQRELTERNIEFCQIPYAIHRILGD